MVTRIVNFEPIREHFAPLWHQYFEQSRLRPLCHFARRFAVNEQGHSPSIGAIRTYNHSAIGWMRAKNRMWILMSELKKAIQFLRRDLGNDCVTGCRRLPAMRAGFHASQVWKG
jgi:hypothetical protein